MKRTGVIVGLDYRATKKQANTVVDDLNKEFPGVTFVTAIGGSGSVVFEYDAVVRR